MSAWENPQPSQNTACFSRMVHGVPMEHKIYLYLYSETKKGKTVREKLLAMISSGKAPDGYASEGDAITNSKVGLLDLFIYYAPESLCFVECID